jgi:hypothetical protein
VVVDGRAISKSSATVDANFARRAKIDDCANSEFIDDPIDRLRGQTVQCITAK